MKKSLLFLLVVFTIVNVFTDADAETYTPPDRDPPKRTQAGGTRNTAK